MTEFSARQFKDGDLVLHCGHVERPMHAFIPPGDEPAYEFTRPDGTPGVAAGLVQCDECVSSPHMPVIVGESIWQGDAPVFKLPPLDDVPKSIRGW